MANTDIGISPQFNSRSREIKFLNLADFYPTEWAVTKFFYPLYEGCPFREARIKVAPLSMTFPQPLDADAFHIYTFDLYRNVFKSRI